MNRPGRTRSTRTLLLLWGSGGCFLLVGLIVFSSHEAVTTAVSSPVGQMRAVLVDRAHQMSIDRNFKVRIERADGASETVFTSPDESPLGIGQERFLWSKDGTRLLLIGKRFWVRKGVQLEGGEVLYLLYDVPTGRVWCNSDQPGFEPFGIAELADYDFGEKVLLSAESNEQPQRPPAAAQPGG